MQRRTYNPDNENQAFYRVLSNDGLTSYTAQDQLSIVWGTDSGIKDMFHPQIGRYFTRFNGRNFELNEEMRTLFPDDERALDEIYQIHSK